jgi:hypothetical protein
MLRFTALLLTFVAFPLPAQMGEDKRLPVPDLRARAKAEQEVNEVFKGEIAKAKAPSGRAPVIAKMIELSRDPKEEPATRWALLELTQSVAVQAGEVELALRAAEEKAKTFQVNPVTVRVETIERLGRGTPSKALLDPLYDTADKTLKEDDYKTTVRLLKLGMRVANQVRDFAATKHFEAQLHQAEALERTFESVKGDQEALARFLCFQRGNWEKGLPLLAKSKDEVFSAVAKKDLGNPADGKGKADLGDAWYELAEKFKGDERLNLLRRAYHWYRQGFPSISGLAKAKVEQRVLKAIEAIDAEDLKAGYSTLFAGRWTLKWSNGVTYELVISSAGKVEILRMIAANGSVTTGEAAAEFASLVRRCKDVNAKVGEAFGIQEKGVINRFRISVDGFSVDRFASINDFPNRLALTGKATFMP